MRTTLPTLLVCLLGCGRPETSSPPPASVQQAIVDGAADTTHTSVIALISLDNPAAPHFAETCTGTVVNLDGGVGQVLTAAHCFDHLDAGWVTFAVTGDDYSDFLDAGLPVRNIQLHPFYAHSANGVFVDDFAMLSFDAPANQTATPVLTAALDDLVLGTNLTLIGFGFTDPNSSDINTGRRFITKPIWQLDDTQIAMDQSNNQGGQCQGDSGGPALYSLSGQEYVAGVISYGDTACDMAGVSGRVSAVEQGFVRQYELGLPPSTDMDCGDCQGQALLTGGACAPAYDECSNTPACVSLSSCENLCGNDAGCVGDCEVTYQLGVAPYDALNDCLCGPACATPCAAECAAPISLDAGTPNDGGMPVMGLDAGMMAVPDAGPMMVPQHSGGCSQAGGELWPLGLVAAVWLARRRARLETVVRR